MKRSVGRFFHNQLDFDSHSGDLVALVGERYYLGTLFVELSLCRSWSDDRANQNLLSITLWRCSMCSGNLHPN